MIGKAWMQGGCIQRGYRWTLPPLFHGPCFNNRRPQALPAYMGTEAPQVRFLNKKPAWLYN